MINIDYDTWQNTVEGILKAYKKSPYIQLIPFTKFSKDDFNFIKSIDFFNKWIKTGAFVYYTSSWYVTNAYIQKKDGTYRKSTNISPIFYLFISSIAKFISKYYQENYGQREIKTFYAGNILENRFYYKYDYNEYYKYVNSISQSYTHFIKLDINNFFSNIDINKMFSIIDNNVNLFSVKIRSRDLLYIKELLKYIGNGSFPIIRNNTGLSYLATVVYLNDFDNDLYDFLINKSEIFNIEMVRYVDDLYILLNLDSECNFEQLIKNIINNANSLLLNINLQLNTEKIKYGLCPEISSTLENSIYDDYVNGVDFSIDDYYTEEKLESFINELYEITHNKIINRKDYNDLIYKSFSIDELTKSANEIFNNLLYKESFLLKQPTIIKKLNFIIENDNQILKLDPSRLTMLILNTRDETLIKNLLNRIFENDRNQKIDIYDIHIALIYLSQRNFAHKALLKIIKKYDEEIYNYIKSFCINNFIQTDFKKDSIKNKFINNLFHKKDNGILYYLYSFYKIKTKEKNYLEAFAYYKNYFDRITAHFDAYINNRKNLNLKGFYKEKDLRKFYNEHQTLITQAHDYRNANPLSHSSAELLDDNESESNLKKIRIELSKVIKQKIKTITLH